jgi:hypothetical protein
MNTEPIFNRAALMPGMIFGRRGTAPISYGIMLRTAGPMGILNGTAWSHDAILIQHNRRWYLGDAEMGRKAALTPLEDWERDMRDGKFRAIVLWPVGATPAHGEQAAWWWQAHIQGTDYDDTAIQHLAWRWLAEVAGNKVGVEENYYCTESCQRAYQAGAGLDPWYPKINSTPGTTWKRTRAARQAFRPVAGAWTEVGKRYRIELKKGES